VWVIPVLLGAGLWMLAAFARARLVPYAVVGSDSLGPYLSAWSLGSGVWPHPPNPESGDALWWMAWPLVRLATSLEALLQLRAGVGGVVAPLGVAAVWMLCRDRGLASRSLAAATAGLWLALEPGLLDTFVSGARSYGAPELAAAMTLGLCAASWGHRWGLVLAVVTGVWAVDHHPIAGGLLLGSLSLVPWLRSRIDVRALGWLALLAGLVALPRALRLVELAGCGQGVMACLGGVAQSNVDGTESLGADLVRAVHDRFAVDLGWPWVGLALGLLLALWPDRTASESSRMRRVLATWAIAVTVGCLLVGGGVSYVRSYHLRIVAAPLVVASVAGWTRLGPASVLLGAWVALSWGQWSPPGEPGLAPGRTDRVAARLEHLTSPVWVDRVWWTGAPRLDASGVVLSAVLQGQDPLHFRTTPDASFILLSVGEPSTHPGMPVSHWGAEVLSAGDDWRVLRFSDSDAARQWVDARQSVPVNRGGAYDWAVVLDPEGATSEQTRW
jgi:hypothetical protein